MVRDPRTTFLKFRERYWDMYSMREKMHRMFLEAGVSQRGHGFFDHDHPVMQICLLIHESESEVRKAWLAAMLHSLDRLVDEEEEKRLIELLLAQAPENDLSPDDMEDIREAVRGHAGPNKEDDSLTKMILQDADRIANSMAIILPRSGQFLPTIPTIELGYLDFSMHPESTFRSPRSVHDNLVGILEWDPEGPEADPKFALRLPLAVEFGRPHFAYLRDWIKRNKAELAMLGLDPWPI